MKKSLWQGISLFDGIINPHEEIHEEDPQDVQRSELDGIIDEIFSVDPRTGLPVGDIQYYLSADGNPAIKTWLENNLLNPRRSSSGSSLEDVSDDLIAEMSRNFDESPDQYIERLASIRDEALNNEDLNIVNK